MNSAKKGVMGKWMGLLACFLLLVACSTTPPTRIHQPMTARPVSQTVIPPADGAIYHAGFNYHPLFEDRRARNVGDILTINIVESTTGSRKTSDGTTSANSINAATPNVTVGPLSKLLLKAFSVNSSSNNKTASTGAGAGHRDVDGNDFGDGDRGDG